MHPDQKKWDRIYTQRTSDVAEPAMVLQENQHLLPASGKALDLACGLGANSLLLAECGLEVRSWDISPVAIEQLKLTAQQRGLRVDAEVIDVMSHLPEANSLDVLVVTHFLLRGMEQSLMAALKPGGLIFYQTYCRDKVTQQGPSNPDYLLADNELLGMFASLKLRVYREESLSGQQEKGWRNQAMLVAQKPEA